MASHTLRSVEVDGFEGMVLAAPDAALEVTFVPRVGMVACSLRHRGEELLGQRGGLLKYAQTGSSMGIPILHPWANRLSALRYTAAGRSVELDPKAPRLRLDPNGLPIHGLLVASPLWEAVGADADVAEARLAARLDFAARPELMRLFPFAHELVLDVRLRDACLTIATTVSATGDGPVPVSFGFHPYFRLPGVPRAAWWVEIPARREVVVDARQLPTGERRPVAIPPGPLGDRTFDTPYDELAPRPTFVLAGGGRRIAVTFDEGYPCAQVFAPAGQEFLCFEPMTAPPDALVQGGDALQLVPPAGRYRAAFSIAVTPDASR